MVLSHSLLVQQSRVAAVQNCSSKKHYFALQYFAMSLRTSLLYSCLKFAIS